MGDSEIQLAAPSPTPGGSTAFIPRDALEPGLKSRVAMTLLLFFPSLGPTMSVQDFLYVIISPFLHLFL